MVVALVAAGAVASTVRRSVFVDGAGTVVAGAETDSMSLQGEISAIADASGRDASGTPAGIRWNVHACPDRSVGLLEEVVTLNTARPTGIGGVVC